MSEKVIWGIVSLMALAIIGVVWLQMDLIGSTIKANERKFDEKVFEALNEVSDQLEQDADKTIYDATASGFMTTFYRDRQPGLQNPINSSILDAMMKSQGTEIPKNLLEMAAAFSQACYCEKCIKDPTNPFHFLVNYSHNALKIPLEERINPKELYTILKRKLKDRGIKIPFNYGVYSTEKETFVIVDDHFVVEDSHPKQTIPGFGNILTTPYEVSLFDDNLSTPGKLKLHFPDKTSFIRQSVWPNFLGSMLLSLIIIFTFAYTIRIVFRQKKIGEMKTDFINNMTHEFKTPIATISLAADSITSPMISGDASKVQRFANIIKQENKRMNKQVEKVLQIARLDRKELSLKISPVDLHEVINNAIEYINLQVDKKGGTAKAVLDAKKAVVEGDMTHISSVINNLLDNANKYSPEKAEITIYTRNVDNGIEVTIEDHGIGMTKETRKHIFDQFYRVHTGNLHDIKGFGLGLSYVKAILQAHKGRVSVKSELGKGSSFILYFPLKQKK